MTKNSKTQGDFSEYQILKMKKELICNNNFVTSRKKIIKWIGKNQLILSEDDILFNLIFNDINKIYEFLKLEKSALKALHEFKKLNLNNEVEILNWLVKHEHLHYALILLHPNTISENGFKFGKEKLSSDLEIYFNIEILKNCIEVEKIMDKHYYSMLNKYTTETSKQRDNQSPFDDNYNKISSLTYHLKERGYKF